MYPTYLPTSSKWYRISTHVSLFDIYSMVSVAEELASKENNEFCMNKAAFCSISAVVFISQPSQHASHSLKLKLNMAATAGSTIHI